MKYTSIIAATALVGADAYNLKNQNKLYAAINDESLVQVEEAKINEQAWGGIEASMHEFPGTVNEHGNWQDAYERVLPERFQGDAADGTAPVDKFTQNLIENYAVEAKTPKTDESAGGEPTGKFWMSKSATNQAAREVLATHKGLTGAKLDTYMNTYFDKAWGHFDVNQVGEIEVIKMPQFIRFLASDQYFQFIQPK